MKNKKYELLKVDGSDLYRIRALKDFSDVRKGDLGGYVQSEENLSQVNNSWIYDTSIVTDNCYISDDTIVKDGSIISGDLTIYNSTIIDSTINGCGSVSNARLTNVNRVPPKTKLNLEPDKNHKEEYFDSHYQSNIQPIEYMQENFTPQEFIGFLKGNIIKYTSRLGKKDNIEKEIAKIQRYTEWLMQAADGKKINPRE